MKVSCMSGRRHPRRARRAAALTLCGLLAPAIAHAQPATTAAERAAAWSEHQSMAQRSIFRGLAWRPVGPVKIGSRIEAVAIPPGNTGTIYAAPASGNLFKSLNNGLTWRPVFEHESACAIGDVAVAPSDANTVWVGTGEAQPRYAGYAYPGTGVFKSVNGGASWTHMGLAGTDHIGKVLIHPSNPNIVYVAAMGRQWTPNVERAGCARPWTAARRGGTSTPGCRRDSAAGRESTSRRDSQTSSTCSSTTACQ